MLSVPDLAVMGALALIVFGPDQLPKVMRKAGQVMRDVQNTSQSFIREMERAADDTPPYVPPKYEPPTYEPPKYEPFGEPYVIPGTEPPTIDASVTAHANDHIMHDATQAIDILAQTVDEPEAALEPPPRFDATWSAAPAAMSADAPSQVGETPLHSG